MTVSDASKASDTYNNQTCLMTNTFYFLTALVWFCLLPHFVFSQDCDITLSGYIYDKGTDIPLEFANVYLKGTAVGVVSDENGFFRIDSLCPDHYHLRVSHIGCETNQSFIDIEQDTVLNIQLEHHLELLDEVIVHGEAEDNSTEVSSTISRDAIVAESNKNLSDILESITGVSTLKSGTGISKPVIHGLYGNRVAILNNGIAQAGQQWGNDHAPEIDPFVAKHLSVVKGAAALEHSSNALGAVVLVETEHINEDPHLHGEAQYIFQSNGRGHTVNTSLEKSSDWVSWRVTGTWKQQGDHRSPNYFLTNTGKKEANLAIQLEQEADNNWHNSFYYSLFNTEIGVLRGSHVGNLTDLQNAINNSVPLFTSDTFSYQINAPRQAVQHHLLKLESKYFINDTQALTFKYGGQINRRREFDVRRSGRTDIPALSLIQQSHYGEAVYQREFDNHLFFKSGLQLRVVDNTNQPETGVFPLIPDYRSFQSGGFLTLQQDKNKLFWELGGRYDLKNIYVVTFSESLPRTIERFQHNFHNYALSTGIKYQWHEHGKTNLNIGYMLRTPEVNELYSFGLHQGVSGLEEGNRHLLPEQSFKIVWSNDWRIKNKLFFQALAYFQHLNSYIYLQPQSEFRLTIRGAFPVFIYEQTDATIFGTDILFKYEPRKDLKFLAKYALVRGRDTRQNLPLINMPADNLYGALTYLFLEHPTFKNAQLSINGKYVFQQTRLEPEQDFLAPPAAYFLLGLSANTSIEWEESKLRFYLRIDNLLNETYRDYLNRLRYFADEEGVNVTVGLNYSF